MEWNVFCIYNVLSLFSEQYSPDGFTGYSLSTFIPEVFYDIDFYLRFFLVIVLFVVPLYGNIYPKNVPFLTAFRPYAGNWRFTWHIVSNKAKEKLRKLRCLEGIFITENAKLLWGGNPHFCSQFEDYFSGNMVFFPHFRPLIPMIEKLEKRMKWKTDDYVTLFNEIFLNVLLDGHLELDIMSTVHISKQLWIHVDLKKGNVSLPYLSHKVSWIIPQNGI